MAVGWAGRSREGGSWSCCCGWYSRVGLGRGLSDPLCSASLNLHTTSRIWSSVSDLGLGGNVDTRLNLELQFPTFAFLESLFGLSN